MHKKFSREGFTLIELTLSILFISVLSLAVALLITNAITAYRRGIILNEINTIGMELVDDMRASVQGAQARSLKNECASFYSSNDEQQNACEDDQGQKFASITSVADVKKNGESLGNMPVFGAFCTGSYSYVWNSGYFFNEEYTVGTGMAKVVYRTKDGDEKSWPNNSDHLENFKILKIIDEDRNICKSLIGGNYNSGGEEILSYSNVFDIKEKSILEEEPEDLLTGDLSLALYDLSAVAVAESSVLNNTLYSASFILGTVQGGINVNTTGNYCTTPEDYDSNFDYCAINKFNFAAQANGG